MKPGKKLLQDGEIQEGPASRAAAKDAKVAAVLSELDDETIQDGFFFREQQDLPLTGFDKSLIKRRGAKQSKPQAVGRLECAVKGLFNQLPWSASLFQMLSTGSLPDGYVR